MIDHTGVNVMNIARSRDFYVAALAPLGYVPVTILAEHAVGFGVASERDPGGDPGGDFWISVGAPQVPRVHVAFRARSHAEVDAFHAAALSAGGRDNGAPGPRPHYHPGYYAAFALDPDGYNIEAVCHLAE
jgi:catechol 2,3-dioxygenase-like lactoylglutathione lyase family enzyme